MKESGTDLALIPHGGQSAPAALQRERDRLLVELDLVVAVGIPGRGSATLRERSTLDGDAQVLPGGELIGEGPGPRGRAARAWGVAASNAFWPSQ